MHKRQHPWLGSKDAYQIWLSEVIMQQTRIEQGTAYFLKFLSRYPTIHHLARAEEPEVLKLWEGLGYYSRARNMLFTAKQVVNEYGGKFPDKASELLGLKGIGKYTAAAILSFAYNKPTAVVDGNVLRVLSRLFGISEAIDSNEGRKKLESLAQKMIDKKMPAKYNQAIMDFGALVCTPRLPDCTECPLSNICYAYQHDMTALLPVKSKKAIKRTRHFNFIVITDEKYTWIEKRVRKDIWMNLFQFPLIETTHASSAKQMMRSVAFKNIFNNKLPKLISVDQFSQQLTHQTIKATFFITDISNINYMPPAAFTRVTKSGLKKYTFPGVIRDYLKEIPIFRS